MENTMNDTTNDRNSFVYDDDTYTEDPTVEDRILADWRSINQRLDIARDEKRQLGEQIKELVAERTQKARLVRVIAPELLKQDSNGE
jgi:hypothetical protein